MVLRLLLAFLLFSSIAHAGTDINPLKSVVSSGKKTVSTAGTAEQLSSTFTPTGSYCIKALHSNTNMVYLGNSTVDSTNGYVLDSGESWCGDLDDLRDMYLDVDTNAEGVTWLAIR